MFFHNKNKIRLMKWNNIIFKQSCMKSVESFRIKNLNDPRNKNFREPIVFELNLFLIQRWLEESRK